MPELGPDYGPDYARRSAGRGYGGGYGDIELSGPGRDYGRQPGRSGRSYGGDYGYEEDRGAPWRGGKGGRFSPGQGYRGEGGRSGAGRGGELSWVDRAADEIGSRMGFEDSERCRQEDHRGPGPKDYQRPDARISEDVHDYLTDDPMVDASNITLTVEGRDVEGRDVTLNGTVSSRQAKRLAEDFAKRASGVTHVQNNLRVKTDDPAGSVSA